jgi:hypothetical protein
LIPISRIEMSIRSEFQIPLFLNAKNNENQNAILKLH